MLVAEEAGKVASVTGSLIIVTKDGKLPEGIDRRIRLRHGVGLFAIRREVIDMLRHPALFDPPIGRFDKAEVIHPGKGCQRSDQADVRTFRCFNRANTPIMGVMHITYIEARTFPAQTARTERRQRTFVA